MFQMLYMTGVYRAFPNTEAALRIYLSLIATNCSGERSFSQLKRNKDVKPVVQEAGVQVHPQKLWFIENPGKILENVDKNSENFDKIPENPNKIPKYLGKISENLGKMAPNVVWLQKMAPKVCRKTSEDHFWGVTPQKRSAKVARQLFCQVCKTLGKNPLHPQEFACSYTYVSNDQQLVNNVLVHWHFCSLKVICLKIWLEKIVDEFAVSKARKVVI